MVKHDNRRINNTSANRNLHTELDLWLAYKENSEEPILLGTAIASPSKGYFGDKYELWYSPCNYMKDKPFLLISEKGITDFMVRCETIRKAKSMLKKENESAKWQK